MPPSQTGLRLSLSWHNRFIEREWMLWGQFFNPDLILQSFGIQNITEPIVDLSCGYGTFTIAAARANQGIVYAMDIENGMIAATQEKANAAGQENVRAIRQDFVTLGTSLSDESCKYVMLFNILHVEEPLKLLVEAKRILKSGGRDGNLDNLNIFAQCFSENHKIVI